MNYDLFYKNVAILCDDIDGFDKNEALRLCGFLKDAGYNAFPVTAAEIIPKDNIQDSFLARVSTLIVPQCDLTPAILMDAFTDFTGRGGNLVTLGGPLFYNNVVSEDGRYVVKEMPESCVDATFVPENSTFLSEGIAPAYKVFRTESKGLRSLGAPEAEGSLPADEAISSVCPHPRNRGIGHFRKRERFIPIVEDENENAVAFFMLSNFSFGGHDVRIPRPGYVVPTTNCRVTAGIGIRRPDILSVKGAGELILSVLSALSRGLWLFEAGVDSFRPKKGEKVKLGASIENSSMDYKNVELEFSAGGKTVFSKKVIAPPRNIIKIENDVNISDILPEGGALVCRLKLDGEVIDEIVQDIEYKKEINAEPGDFVTVKDGAFYLGGKRWQAVAMNYWPSFYLSLEVVDYWKGWLDTETYDPIVVERDLARMEALGINCLLTRIDTFDNSRLMPALSDFIERMREHNMKLCLAYPFIETPTHYHPDAFREFIDTASLRDEPVIMAHDISWEVGNHFISAFRESYTEDWNKWIEEHYSSVENALADWGYTPDGTCGNFVPVPVGALFASDGDHRVYVTAFRRFMDDHLGRIWLDAVTDMRSVCPNHLFTYRQGPSSFYDLSYSATHTATDFICPEGYHISGTEEGYAEACFSTVFLRTLSGGKPIFWAEYGKGLCGNKWQGVKWDHENFGFNPKVVEEQTAYLDIFHRMMVKVRAEGSGPWWWGGGFRRTEMSDFGYCNSDGTLRPCAVEYGKTAETLWNTERTSPTKYITVDRDADARGNQIICDTVGRREWLAAEAEGEYLGIRLIGDDSDTENLPALAVGNVPFTGKNPHKYLASLFKSAEKTDGGIKLSFFNTERAKWLASNTFIKVEADGKTELLPINADTERLGYAEGFLPYIPEGDIKAVMYTEKAGEFGEKYKITKQG